jgi:hypothetical protein
LISRTSWQDVNVIAAGSLPGGTPKGFTFTRYDGVHNHQPAVQFQGSGVNQLYPEVLSGGIAMI